MPLACLTGWRTTAKKRMLGGASLKTAFFMR